ncbi:glutathione S-transferase family protein [Pseudoroseicyclus sp. H15]
MITVYGEGRGTRVVWLFEEMGLPYRLHRVNLLSDVSEDTEFMAANPAGFIPAMRDGDVVMIESLAIVEYLMARYGPTPLMPSPDDPSFPAYKQFLWLGEAGIGQAMYFYGNALRLPEDQRDNPTAKHTLYQWDSRLAIVERRLTEAPYMAGEAFTAADISVGYTLNQAHYSVRWPLSDTLQAYRRRLTERPAFQRMLDACPDTGPYYRKIDAEEA